MTGILTDIWSNLTFQDPGYLYGFVLWAVLFFLWIVFTISKIKNRPEKTHGSVYPLIGKIKLWGLFALPALSLMILALAKPHIGKDGLGFSQGSVEIVVVVDRSISGRGNDVHESRLEIAKREALRIENFVNAGDKLALFVFGSESNLKTYLTESHNSVFQAIGRIAYPKSLKSDGLVWDSDFAAMLTKIYQSLDHQDSEGVKGKFVPKKRTNRIVILFTDGEDQFRKSKPSTEEEKQEKTDYNKRLTNALSEFKRRGLKIYPVGIGTEKGVSWVSLLRGYKPEEDYPKYLTDPADRSLALSWIGKTSRLDKENLLFLARTTGVDPVGNIWTVERDSTTVRIYLNSVINANRDPLPSFTNTGNNEQPLWQYLLLLGMVFIGCGILTYPFRGYFRKE